jgi:hypothetical protein
MKRGSATYTSRRRLRIRFPTVISLPRGAYERSSHLFWRIRILLSLPLLVAGWYLLRGYGLFTGAAVGVLVEGIASYRKRDGQLAAPITTRGDAHRPAHPASSWDTDATPSPGGWQPPRDRLPGWNWAPPGGLRPRFDRLPPWVRLWYRTPFVDRYAHAWMWRHGGWDVLPPSRLAE